VTKLSLRIPDEPIEAVAARVAEVLAGRVDE
jgi:hypothetical protein